MRLFSALVSFVIARGLSSCTAFRNPASGKAARPRNAVSVAPSFALLFAPRVALSFAPWVALSFALSVAMVLGCNPCDGDRVKVDGMCLPRCSDEACGDGLVCVHSTCRPACERRSDCRSGDVCQKLVTDEGHSGKYCYGPALDPSPYTSDQQPAPSASDDSISDEPRPAGAASCKKNSECDQSVPRHCVDSVCRTACTLHEHCGRAGACTGHSQDADGALATYCEPDGFPRAAGQYGNQCLTGPTDCDLDNGFQCIRAGDGDLTSYCTRAGCDDSSQCPSGFACSQHRVGQQRPPCADACGVAGDPRAENCIPTSEIGEGKAFRCADGGGLVLHLCMKRSFCFECETDADCRGEPNQVCAKGPDGNKTCTILCVPEQRSCPWGAATECALFDDELGKETCGHRFGACAGSGRGCEPCTHDGDCPTGFCARSDFSGEQFCYDADAVCECAPGEDMCVGGGCPQAPSGKRMNCVSAGNNQPPSACYGSELDVTSQAPLGCW